MFKKFLLISCTALSLSACIMKDFGNSSSALAPTDLSTIDTGEPKTTSAKAFTLAEQALEDGDKKAALSYYDEIVRLYPGSKEAELARLKSAWALYRMNKHDEALIRIDRFITRHPNSSELDYAYWLKGLCYFERIPSVQRDQNLTLKSLEAFSIVVQNYPDSPYAKDSKVKRDFLLDHLAGKEMDIGRQYLKRKNYTSAINRFKYVTEKFDTTSHVPEALHRQVEAYLALGLKDEAVRAAQVLGHNFPGSDWYKRSFKLINQYMAK